MVAVSVVSGSGSDDDSGAPPPSRIEVSAGTVVVASPTRVFYRPAGAGEPETVMLTHEHTSIAVADRTRVIVTTNTAARRDQVEIRGAEDLGCCRRIRSGISFS